MEFSFNIYWPKFLNPFCPLAWEVEEEKKKLKAFRLIALVRKQTKKEEKKKLMEICRRTDNSNVFFSIERFLQFERPATSKTSGEEEGRTKERRRRKSTVIF